MNPLALRRDWPRQNGIGNALFGIHEREHRVRREARRRHLFVREVMLDAFKTAFFIGP